MNRTPKDKPRDNAAALAWEKLEYLRSLFLQERPIRAGAYWIDPSFLQAYDQTFAERIGWKWDAVLAQLRQLGWQPPYGSILDWGCGTGIATRCWISAWGPASVKSVYLLDASKQAVDYATARLRETVPQVDLIRLELTDPIPELAVLLVSHVVTELDEKALALLLATSLRAQTVVWIEPGSYSASRKLIYAREALITKFNVILPCPQQDKCPIAVDNLHTDWCHFFAPVPKGVMNDPNWTLLARRLGIDLRALPYSVLVLDRRQTSPVVQHPPCPEGFTIGRIVGRPHVEKGLARLYVCTGRALRLLILPKRVNPPLHHALRKTTWPTWIAFRAEGSRICHCYNIEALDHGSG